jgi:integrase
VKKRRGHGEGSIYQRPDGRWVAMLDMGIIAGRRRRRAFYGSTQAEAVAKLNAVAHAARQGVPVPLERQTFGAFAERWLRVVEPSLREPTFRRYTSLLAHAMRVLGRTSLSKLAPADLQRLYDERRKAGAAPRTILHIHRVIHRALRDAERWGDVARNVARLVDPPRVSRRELRTLTADEARQLMRAAEGDRLEAVVVLALTTGMRMGELLGLTWRALDLERGAVRVQASLQRTAAGLALVEPKTARSRRQIEIEPRVVAALRRHRAEQLQERLAAGPLWVDGDFVFATPLGAPIDGRELLRAWFRPLLLRAGLPPIRFHDLRHSYASIALARGLHPKVVQEAMGHSTIAVTMDLYSHVVPSLQREAAREMGAALFGV